MKTIPAWVFASLVLLVAFLILFDKPLNLDTASSQPYPPPMSDDVASNEIRTYQKMLEGNLDEQMRKSIEEKLAIAERVATQFAKGQQIQDWPEKTPQFIQVTDGPAITGIFEGQGQEIRPSVAVINNGWAGFVQDLYILVFAGSLVDDPTQGVLYVLKISDDRTRSEWSRYLTPSKNGSLRIVREENSRLLLSSDLGSPYYFDIPGMQFASSMTEVIPTITPGFSFTPVNPYP